MQNMLSFEKLFCLAQLVDLRTGTPLRQVRFPGAARDFSPRVYFQCRLSHGVRTPPCATACIYICTHVKDPVVHIRVRWIMETLKHTACTVGWVARLCRSWLSPGKSNPNPNGTIQLLNQNAEDKVTSPLDLISSFESFTPSI